MSARLRNSFIKSTGEYAEENSVTKNESEKRTIKSEKYGSRLGMEEKAGPNSFSDIAEIGDGETTGKVNNSRTSENDEYSASASKYDADSGNGAEEKTKFTKEVPGVFGIIIRLILCLLCGIVFGFCLGRGRAVLEYIACFTHKGIVTSAIGAFVLGCGMTLSGACPGMILAQIGSWVPNSIFTAIGCLVGALTYGMAAPVNQTLKLPFIAVALPMAVMLLVAIILLEVYWDYSKDLEYIGRKLPPYSNIVTAVAWMPSVTGAIIGLIQLPLVFTVHDTMGGSSAYVTIVSQWVVTKRLQEMFPYLAAKRCGLGNWWQVIYVSGAVLGAALASVASDTMATSHGVNLPTSIIGGILMLWGARFASGCTSGHGLSGMGLLAWLSFVAVPCMFAGGIVTAFSMKATGDIDDYVTTTGGS
ncbi:YEEE-like protein [Mya arenaria]|uniref:YEEE-like protein n=1 Tax=Mya arenaria TaxID=6604 RepID=A0ABY7GEB0_MYAAR|nr:YEEE-like protein [Mya arenaria]